MCCISLPGTYRFFNAILSNYGIETTFINTTDTDVLEKTIKDNTKVRTTLNFVPLSCIGSRMFLMKNITTN